MRRQSPKTLNELNTILKESINSPFTAYQRGNKLYLRGQMPPKPNSNHTKWKQQFIAMNCHANPSGFRKTLNEAIKIEGQINTNVFDWKPYLRHNSEPELDLSIVSLIQRYEEIFFQARQRNPTTEQTWKNHHLRILKRLLKYDVLTEQIIVQEITNVPPETHDRNRTCWVLRKLLEISRASFRIDFELYFSNPKEKARNIPDAETIVQCVKEISDPEVKAVVSYLATFGVRPHELPLLQCNNFKNGREFVEVPDETKTGRREVYPLYPEWVELFNLRQLTLPQFELVDSKTGKRKTGKQLGAMVGRLLKSQGLPFFAYDLRHAYAIRGIDLNISTRLMSKWMGHSEEMHYKTYNKWLSRDDSEKFFKQIKDKRN